MKMFHYRGNKTGMLILTFLFFLLLITHFFGYTGPFGFDDLEYARLAHLFFKGEADWTHPFTYRFGIVLPTGFFHKLLGVSDAVSAIYPLIISCGIIFQISYVLKGKPYQFFLACCIFLACPWIIFYSDKTSADMPLVFCLLLTTVVLYNSRFNFQWKKKQVVNGILLAISAFAGLLTKETIWFVFPMLLFFFIADIIRKERLTFWLSAIFALITLLFFYCLWQKVFLGEWFYRVNLIKSLDNINTCSYDRQPFQVAFERIAYKLWVYLIQESSFVFPVIFIIACLSKAFFKNLLSKENFWIVSAIILVLGANFWSISYNSYHPLCIDIRHYLYVVPVSAIAIAFNYQKLFRKKAILFIILSCLAIFALKKQLNIKEIAAIQAIVVAILFLLIFFFNKYRKYLLGLIFILPLINIIYQIKAAISYDYKKQKETALNFLGDKKNTIIYTSETQARLFDYYKGFENANNLEIIPYRHFTELKEGFHFYNYHAAFLSEDNELIPSEIKLNSTNESLILDMGYIKIWKINPNKDFREIKANLIDNAFWDKGESKNGIFCLGEDDEFSPTFKAKIDNKVKSIYISTLWELKNTTGKDASIVISIEEDGKQLFWKQYTIFDRKAAVNSFYLLKRNYAVDSFKINKQAELKIYIWNNLKTQLEIKNADVELILK